jgi:MFS family permease
MVGGVISDIYHAADRNTPMSYFAGSVLFGTGLGPLITGFIQQRASWRWIYYSQAIAAAGFLIILWFFLKETRGSVLLSRKAKTLNKYYEALEDGGYYGVVFESSEFPEKQQVQRIRWKVKSDEERETLAKMISISCYRPFREYSPRLKIRERPPLTCRAQDLLFTEPVVFFFSLWVAFSWAILYLKFSAIPLVFSTNHNFNVEQNGAVFSGIYIPGRRIFPRQVINEA